MSLNIIIPLGGTGERFKEGGYRVPKPLINVLGEPMISRVLNSLSLSEDDRVFVFYNKDLDDFGFSDIMERHHPNVQLVAVPNNTTGPVDTLYRGILNLANTEWNKYAPTVVLDGDTFYTEDILQTYRATCDSRIFYSHNTDPNPIYSYIEFDATPFAHMVPDARDIFDATPFTHVVTNVREKEKISDWANTGCYCFSSTTLLYNLCKKVLECPNYEKYTSDLYREMLDSNIPVYCTRVDKFHCVGTPAQLQSYCGSQNRENITPKRFCFDLDGTLVTAPSVTGDYTTVRPITKNIDYVNYLKSLGHTIIINTARRMKTHAGNVGKVVADISNITIQQLDNFEIQYDELYFGKPHAHYYIDDLAISVHSTLAHELGYYPNTTDTRKFNNVATHSNGSWLTKTSTSPDFDGEIFFYRNIPDNIRHLFPTMAAFSTDSLVLEMIYGRDLSLLYASKSMDIALFRRVLNSVGEIHNSSFAKTTSRFYANYNIKLWKRFLSFPYNRWSNSWDIARQLSSKLYTHQEHGMELVPIHGDCVFSNIMLSNDNSLKFIDMRGKVGDTLTIYGDRYYDYAKIYQSVIGYDFILHNKDIDHKFVEKYQDEFQKHCELNNINFDKVKVITASLLFTLIPLHDDEKCDRYYSLMETLL